jgi:hypothetical protein
MESHWISSHGEIEDQLLVSRTTSRSARLELLSRLPESVKLHYSALRILTRHRFTATTVHTASTKPKGHAPCKNP